MIKAAFIGTGGISGMHLEYLQGREDVEVAALCDLDEASLHDRQKEFGGEAFTDFRKMLEQVKPDAVWLCTPPQVRAEPLLACAELGIPVFCEKPVERSADRAAEIVRELGKRYAHVQVGYQFRSIPVVEQLRKEMEDDRIHVIQSFYGCDMSLKNNAAPWFYDKSLSGGALIDQATHNLDLLRRLMGEVSDVQGVARNPVRAKEPGYTIDEALALTLVFESGVVGSHIHTWVGDTWRNEILMSGEKRIYRLNLGDQTLAVEAGGEVHILRKDHLPMRDYENAIFLDMVKTRDWSRNPTDYADGLKTLRLTLACDRAVEEGSEVPKT